jgi:energy-coupling factor transporter ATP-binding protein EcfA2
MSDPHLQQHPESDQTTNGTPRTRGAVDVASFILDAPRDVPAIWGTGQRVGWAEGEPLLIVGPEGVGKTTLVQRLVLHRLGIREGDVLGLPVAVEGRKVLYIAADRPRQAQRSFGRMCGEEDRRALAEWLAVWRGPLPFDLSARPEALAEFAAAHDAGTVVIDSLKDVARDLSKDETGSAVAAAFQHAVADGIQVAALHHQRKTPSGVGAAAPKRLADVYGSTWITAATGSVVLLWGDPGDPLVEMRHLKQPAEEIGPYTVQHDHEAGLPTIHHGVDLYTLLLRSAGGLTVKDAAAALFVTTKPTRNEVEKARRKLELLARDNLVIRVVAGTSTEPDVYRVLTRDSGGVSRGVSRLSRSEDDLALEHASGVSRQEDQP